MVILTPGVDGQLSLTAFIKTAIGVWSKQKPAPHPTPTLNDG